MSQVYSFAMRRTRTVIAAAVAVAMVLTLGAVSLASAANTSNLTQVINAGTLSVDIVDAAYATVASPAVAMAAQTFSFSCQTSTGTFGTATEQVYVVNPDAADGGWSVTIAASATTATWASVGSADFDFNEAGTGGCVDDGATTDADAFGGQLTIDPSGATLDVGACASCAVTNVTLGSSSAFVEGTTDSITLLTGAAASDDIGDWTIENISLSQQIPAEQPADTDYNINMVLTIS